MTLLEQAALGVALFICIIAIALQLVAFGLASAVAFSAATILILLAFAAGYFLA